MIVSNWMSKKVVTIDVNDSMQDAMKRMKQNDIRMLPVVKKEKLVGVVTDRDLKRASASNATTLDVHELLYLVSKIKVQDVMAKNAITVPQNYTIEESAEVLLKNKISGVPVVDQNGGIVGTITQTDLFCVIIPLTGVGTRGIQFAFQLDDRPGSIKEVCDVIRRFNGRIVSILTSYQGVTDGYRKVYIRIHSIERSKLQQLKEELNRMAALMYMVDHRENKREIY